MFLSNQTPVWIAAKGLLAERGDDFFQCLEKSVSTFDAEDIHDLRVASRRLREGLALFTPCYPKETMTKLRKRIRKVTSMLGDLRNVDVALVFFKTEAAELEPDHGAGLSQFIGRYEKHRRNVRKRLKHDLKSVKPGSLRKMFVRTVHKPYLFSPRASETVNPFTPVVDFARSSFDVRLMPLLDLVPQARVPEAAAVQHRLRIAVKRYRYRMEVLSPLMESGARELLGHLKNYQEVLGRIHDLDVFAELVGGIGLSSNAEQSLVRLIAAKRDSAVRIFIEKLDVVPFEDIDAKARRLL